MFVDGGSEDVWTPLCVMEERRQQQDWDEANPWRSTLDILEALSTPDSL